MRRPREDRAGLDWLITNRGLSKRAVFETQQDVERFMQALAGVVEAGLIEVFAYVFLTTHFHLLARSLVGENSLAMKLASNDFVRWFNRSRKRDGPLFAGRFHGSPIEPEEAEHWLAALRYIDLNPVHAGMCRVPSDHPHGSARAYRYERGPDWLSRGRVHIAASEFFAPDPFLPVRYDEFACAADAKANAYVIERYSRSRRRNAPPLTDLIRTAHRRQQGWMEWKAALADGGSVGTAFLPPAEAIRAARLVERRLRSEELPARSEALGRDLAAGMLRGASGRTITEIADDLGVARSTVQRSLRRHECHLRVSQCYADLVARALQHSVRRVFPNPVDPLALPIRVAGVNVMSLERSGAETPPN